ncbi:LacI family DNA-binding transcriptional regulator [Thermosediminibacter oceani]|uniref:Transcriptional regulator, LacI family n=1 Tax=Thermosediminibacter oceani (strain ATCC BAA-1034 / DSM 16646 / JW/IW-1228P) TaxID=555079 RepID=D9RZ54_THEOJ|nr:LacI family DNA-binding transcriptional regulator [Thermosediminibacter oceani]ADL08608.1 transcriptional regulator, LacI family [Thermosediminibacter oceani DSM 16646]
MKNIRKQPTIKDVAREAGVSLKTVSRVINNSSKVKPETREKVLKAIKTLGYRPNAVARGLRIKKTYSIGVIIADITNNFYSNIVRGIEDVALSRNYSMLLANSDEMLSKEKLYTRVFTEKQIEGMIIVPSAGSKEYLKPLLKNVPIVFIDRDVEELEVSSVTVDNERGAYELTKHLIVDHGYTKIAYISHTMGVTTSDKRYEGFKRALYEFGITPIAELIKLDNKTAQDGYRATKEIISSGNRPQAIFTSNNVMALGAMKALEYYSLEAPRDIALVTFDDIKWAEGFRPHLTVMSQPAYEIGRHAANILFKQMDGESKLEKVVLPTQLIIRDSCGCTMIKKNN